MGSLQSRIKKRIKALERIAALIDNPSHVLIIHYSCESFYDITDGRTPRVTSIAVRFLETAQTKSFSIHKIAERKKIKNDDIENFYDSLEKEMLDEFFSFVKEHNHCKWIHWNMRDINYGFEAIENRYIVLGGSPEVITDEKKLDLARYLVSIYGLRYMSHPRLEKLIIKNGISKINFLLGAEEAEAFDKKEYVKLHQSTLRKVDVIHIIAERTSDGTLKTNAKLKDIYGLTPQGIFELIKDNWFFALVATIIGILLGVVISNAF